MFLDQTKKLLIASLFFFTQIFGSEKPEGFSFMHDHPKLTAKKSLNEFYYLSSIIFYEKNNWVIWLNGEKKTSSQDVNLPFNIEVFSDFILLQIKNGNDLKDVKLFPNQTIDLKDYKTYNGDYREKLEQEHQKEPTLSTEGEDFDF
jgi:hypothetical protein